MAADAGVPFLGRIPMDPAVVLAGERGVPHAQRIADSPTAASLLGRDRAAAHPTGASRSIASHATEDPPRRSMSPPSTRAARLWASPVPPIGGSLGVDLVPIKTCTYDCVYCQLNARRARQRATSAGSTRRDVVAQVRAKLESEPDVIALAGSGDPALRRDRRRGRRHQAITDVPVAVITNGSLLGRRTVRAAAADIVLPSLDAVDDDLFPS